jgi:hypothetical protein
MNACLSVWGDGQEYRPAGALADGQIDRPGSARR